MWRDFRFKSFSLGVLGYPSLAVVGELGSVCAKLHWLLLFIFLLLPFAMWFSQVLTGLDVSDWSKSLWRQIVLCDVCWSRPLGGRQSWLWLGHASCVPWLGQTSWETSRFWDWCGGQACCFAMVQVEGQTRRRVRQSRIGPTSTVLCGRVGWGVSAGMGICVWDLSCVPVSQQTSWETGRLWGCGGGETGILICPWSHFVAFNLNKICWIPYNVPGLWYN